MPSTISFYISKKFLLYIGIVFFTVISLIILIDSVELLRKASGKDIPFSIMIQLVLLKLPSLLQQVSPFAVLIGASLTFSKLTKTTELVIVRASGVSVWRFLFPVILIAVVIGIFFNITLTPLSSSALLKYEMLEGKYLKGKISSLNNSSSGLWLKQQDKNGETIIHALRSFKEEDKAVIFDVIIFQFEEGKLLKRIDADKATLNKGFWLINKGIITKPDKSTEKINNYKLSTTLTPKQIQASFSPPETVSFFELPSFIKNLEALGFPVLSHKIYWHSLLSTPILLSAMILIAASFTLRFTNRKGKTGGLIAASILSGFLIYFLSSIMAAIGLSGAVSIKLAVWSIPFASLLLGLTALLHYEE